MNSKDTPAMVSRIFTSRGESAMLYGVETKQFNRVTRRNAHRLRVNFVCPFASHFQNPSAAQSPGSFLSLRPRLVRAGAGNGTAAVIMQGPIRMDHSGTMNTEKTMNGMADFGSLSARLKTPVNRRVRARGLQKFVATRTFCRPGALTGRVPKRALIGDGLERMPTNVFLCVHRVSAVIIAFSTA